MKWKVLAIVVLLAGAGTAVAASLGVFGPGSVAATTYLTARAEVADVLNEVAATGTIAASTTWGLAFGSVPRIADDSSSPSGAGSVTWPVASVGVKVGDSVKKGQLLATAATVDLEAQIADAARAFQAAAIQLEQAQDQLDAATTTDATRQAQLGLYNAETGMAHARATLADLKAQRALATITAPEAGVVTAVAVRAGADAPAGDAITLAASPYVVTTSVVESDVAAISVGQPATVTVAALGGATITGTVASIAPSADTGNNNGVVSFAVQVTLVDPPAGLRPGMTADVTITTASAPGVLAIPSRALAGTAGAYRVRVLNADGSVTTRDVGVGLITSSLVEITSGLQAGDEVITGTSAQQSTVNRQGTGTFGGPGLGGGGGNVRVVTP
jgi:macrolide-specific efflux system membrane fusion protein